MKTAHYLLPATALALWAGAAVAVEQPDDRLTGQRAPATGAAEAARPQAGTTAAPAAVEAQAPALPNGDLNRRVRAADGPLTDIPDPADVGPAPAAAPFPADRRMPAASPDGDLPADLAELRERLVTQLERAADAGLITLRDRPEDAAAKALRAEPDIRSPGGDAVVDDSVPELEPNQGSETTASERDGDTTGERPPLTSRASAPVATVTAAEAPAAVRPEAGTAVASRGEPITTPPAPGCHVDALLALPSSDSPEDFLARLAELRIRLVGEFDRVDPDAARALARHYLGAGLSDEALAVLRSFAATGPETALLASMAKVIEGRDMAPGHALSARGCEGAQALWSHLAAADGDAAMPAPAADEALAETLRRMPSWLAVDFVGRLATAAYRDRRTSDLEHFLALAGRLRLAGEPVPPALRLLQARINLDEGQHEAGIAALRKLWGEGPGTGAYGATLLLLARVLLDEPGGGPVGAHNLRLDLGAMARMRRDTPEGRQALVAEAMLSARDLGREAALPLLASALAEGALDAAGHTAALAELATLPGRATDRPLALAYADAPGRFADALADPAFRLALVRSFADIGLPERAEDLMEPTDLSEADTVVPLIAAYLDAGTAEKARKLAAGLAPGMLPETLETKLALAGQPPGDELLDETLVAGADPAEIARAAWRRRDWEAAAAALGAGAGEGGSPGLRTRFEHARRQASGAAPGDGPPTPTRTAVEGYLDTLRSEIDLLKKALDDG